MERIFDQLNQFLGQDRRRQEEYQEFARRYQEDPDSISDAEAARRYRELMAQVRDDTDYGDQEPFTRLSPEERRALAQRYQEATRDPSRPFQGYPEHLPLEQAAEPQELARMTRRAAREDADLLEQLVGPDSPLNSRAARLLLAGGAAILASRVLGRR
ncbi:hypothetical protein [Kallotenue papyrolyticum]|uniref:hypothetical protein n=1 Tax=Kallotenue papyrolyticum TaxID=1325125 RepID=UPI0004924073|nr:hypothetical protein [Kallotenue papyrolyticum]